MAIRSKMADQMLGPNPSQWDLATAGLQPFPLSEMDAEFYPKVLKALGKLTKFSQGELPEELADHMRAIYRSLKGYKDVVDEDVNNFAKYATDPKSHYTTEQIRQAAGKIGPIPPSAEQLEALPHGIVTEGMNRVGGPRDPLGTGRLTGSLGEVPPHEVQDYHGNWEDPNERARVRGWKVSEWPDPTDPEDPESIEFRKNPQSMAGQWGPKYRDVPGDVMQMERYTPSSLKYLLETVDELIGGGGAVGAALGLNQGQPKSQGQQQQPQHPLIGALQNYFMTGKF